MGWSGLSTEPWGRTGQSAASRGALDRNDGPGAGRDVALNAGARQDLAAAGGGVLGEARDEGVRRTMSLFDERGELRNEHALRDARERRAAELGGERAIRDRRANRLELGEGVIADELIGLVERLLVV